MMKIDKYMQGKLVEVAGVEGPALVLKKLGRKVWVLVRGECAWVKRRQVVRPWP